MSRIPRVKSRMWRRFRAPTTNRGANGAPVPSVEVIHCPVCENQEGLSLVERFGRFSIHSCPACEVQFACPLSYSAAFYDEHYNNGGLGLTRVRMSTHSSMVAKSYRMISGPQRMVLQWLKRSISISSAVLEVGFGGGWFLAALEREGYIAMGIEVAKEPVAVLMEKGFSVSLSPVGSLPSDWPAPQAVVLLEVLEHVPDPLAFLRTLRDNFPHAPLVLSTPSPKRWSLGLGYRESYDYPPHHLTRWNERSLRFALRRAGYAEVKCLYPPVDPGEFYSTLLGMILARLHLLSMSSPEASIKDNQGQLLLSRVVSRFPGLTLRIHDIGLAIFRTLMVPLARYFHRRGWSSGSMLAIGLPAGWKEGSASV